MTYSIEVRLSAEHIKPTSISASDVSELIKSVEQSLIAIVLQNKPQQNLSETDIIIGLSRINLGSYAPVLVAESYTQEIEQAAHIMSAAINSEEFELLPRKSIESLKSLRKITQKYDSKIEIAEINGHRRQLATFTSESKIDSVQSSFIEGRTTLYGYVLGVSGINPPYLNLRLLSGEKFRCHVTSSNDLRVARALGKRLYTDVGVRGVGRWDTSDMSLNHFLVEDITLYEKTSAIEALDSLHDLVGEDFQQIADIEMLIADLRGNDEGIE